jgi:hypothetical protein
MVSLFSIASVSLYFPLFSLIKPPVLFWYHFGPMRYPSFRLAAMIAPLHSTSQWGRKKEAKKLCAFSFQFYTYVYEYCIFLFFCFFLPMFAVLVTHVLFHTQVCVLYKKPLI